MHLARHLGPLVGFLALWLTLAPPAWGQDAGNADDATAFLTVPSSRAQQTAVDAYLATARSDASLVGGPGTAGYDGGFWIRGGSFLLKTNLTIQARYEAFLWDDEAIEPKPGGELSGWSLPRLTLKISGDAACCVHYYAELEFGHAAMVGM